MDRNNVQDELIDLGSVTSETKGPPSGVKQDFGLPLRDIASGLSND